jgi:hypothetical protein
MRKKLALCALALGLLAGFGEAAAGGGGSITGTLLDFETQTAIEGVCASAHDLDGLTVAEATTGADGSFEIGGLSPGTYRVRFEDCREGPEYVAEWWNDAVFFETAALVTVAAGQARELPPVFLQRGGLISGQLTEEETGGPIALGCVLVFDALQRAVEVFQTDLEGRYQVPLTEGTYRVFFSDCLSQERNPEWYRDRPTFETASRVSVGGPGTKRSGISASLRLTLLGDADCDEERTAVDATVILQGVAALIPYLPCQYNSDIDRDGSYGPTDATLILQFVAGLIDDLPP